MPELFEKITAPVAGDSPFGADIRHDLDYERLKGEMGKLGDIDTGVVETLAVKILAEKSKDVRAMAWLAYAVMRANDHERLADVFAALAGYCRDSFDQIFPARESAKLSALRWFAESRFSGQCDKVTASAADVPHVTRLADALSQLRAALDAKFSDGAPPMSLLYKRAGEWKRAAEAEAARASSDAGAPDAPDGGNAAADNGSNAGAGIESAGNMDAGGDTVGGVTLKLTRTDYLELSRCVQKIKTLLTIK